MGGKSFAVSHIATILEYWHRGRPLRAIARSPLATATPSRTSAYACPRTGSRRCSETGPAR